MTDEDIGALLAKVASNLPGGGEERPGQFEMARAVAEAIDTGRHLVVQAGTGTGKSLAYLVPAVLSGRKVVVATATKALQDQLAGKDVPALSRVGLTCSFVKATAGSVRKAAPPSCSFNTPPSACRARTVSPW